MGNAWLRLREPKDSVSPTHISLPSFPFFGREEATTPDNDSSRITESELLIVNKIVNEFGYSKEKETFFVEWRKGSDNSAGEPQKQCIIRSDEKPPKVIYLDNPGYHTSKLKVEKIGTATLFNISNTSASLGLPDASTGSCLSRKPSHPLQESLCFRENVEGEGIMICNKEIPRSFKSFPNLVDLQSCSDGTSLKSALKDFLDVSRNEKRHVDHVDFKITNEASKKYDTVEHFVDARDDILYEDLKGFHSVNKRSKQESIESYLKIAESVATSGLEKKSEDGESNTLTLSFTREINAESNSKMHYIKLPPSMDPNMGLGGYLPSLNDHVKECIYSSWKKCENTHWAGVPRIKDIDSLASPLVVTTGGLNLLDMKDYYLSASLFCYNLKKDRWEFLDFMPEPRSYHASVVTNNNKIYIVGGYCPFLRHKGDMVATPTTYCLDIKTMKWRRLPDLNCARAGHAIAALKNKIYVFGGRDQSGTILKTIEVYCPIKRSWSLQEKMPMPMMGCGFAHDESKVWLIGGVTSTTSGKFLFIDTVFLYDTKNEKWIKGTPLPEPRAYCGAAICQGRLWVCGGAMSKLRLQSTNAVLVLDEKSKSWEEVTRLDPARHASAICTTSDKVMLVGGACSYSRSPLTAVTVFDTKSPPQHVAGFPSPVVGCSVVEILPK